MRTFLGVLVRGHVHGTGQRSDADARALYERMRYEVAAVGAQAALNAASVPSVRRTPCW